MTDTRDIEAFLSGLAGKTCWRVRDTFADQLALDIGERPKQRSSRIEELGEWYIGSLHSDWWATRPGEPGYLATSREPIKVGVAALKVIEQARVQSARVSSALSLSVRFDNGVELEFRPPGDVRDVDECWEILGPGHLLLSAGPGSTCRIRRSDVPLRDLD